MRELDEKDLERVSGGAGDTNATFEKLWNQFVADNCGGCTRKDEAGCQTAMHQIRGAIARQIALKEHPSAPSRCPHRWPI